MPYLSKITYSPYTLNNHVMWQLAYSLLKVLLYYNGWTNAKFVRFIWVAWQDGYICERRRTKSKDHEYNIGNYCVMQLAKSTSPIFKVKMGPCNVKNNVLVCHTWHQDLPRFVRSQFEINSSKATRHNHVDKKSSKGTRDWKEACIGA